MRIIHNFIPATYLVQGMKNIMLKGQGLTEKENLAAAAVMVLTIVGGGLISMKLFRWEKEEKIRGSAKLWVLAGAGAVLCDGRLEVVSYKLDSGNSGTLSGVNPCECRVAGIEAVCWRCSP